ncbi:MAG: hypothetical protein R3297_06435 [Desulfobulbales bacterium]|nr:hypothetical protein [Desulfobulbales bacterium]
MKIFATRLLFTGLILVLSIAGPAPEAGAESIAKCHCFTERSYNPAQRFAADEYILATSFNSLLAKYYGIPKRKIVMIKMSDGVSREDLLISLQLSLVTAIDCRKFLGMRREQKTWRAIIRELSQQEALRKDATLQALTSGMPVKEAAVRIIDEMISTFYNMPMARIIKIRKSGLNEKEINLLLILAHRSSIQPEVLREQYNKQGRSWSEIAHNLGLEPETAAELILAYPAKQVPR